jgi:hypothetical protein
MKCCNAVSHIRPIEVRAKSKEISMSRALTLSSFASTMALSWLCVASQAGMFAGI